MTASVRLSAAMLLVGAVSLGCSAQSKSAALESAQVEKEVSSFAGCYEVRLGRWWPWAFGEDTALVTPPNRIELLPQKGTEGFEKEGHLIRALPDKNGHTSGREAPSYWQVKSADRVYLIWNDGFTGVTLDLEKHATALTGWAHPRFDARRLVPRVAHVTAKRTTCSSPQ
jgi:hypothetical protein